MTPLVEASTTGAAAAKSGADLAAGYATAFLVAAIITAAGTALVAFLPRPERQSA